MISRIAISDISPAVFFGGEFLPVKAVPGERVLISATIVIEGHEKLSAEVVLHADDGKVISRNALIENWPSSDRYEGEIFIPSQGDFFFIVEADSKSLYRTVLGSTEKYPIRADRGRALTGAWYEFFPRSEGAIKSADGLITSGTFKTAQLRIPAVAAMGFNVLYLPPIHPIGLSHRKGANNALTATPDEPGVPWAIGSVDGGHDAINPELGTMGDFEDFLKSAQSHGLEIALDLALQTSPDHPWVRSNPEWFNKRADGTIAYAENPPKKYQDIYPLNFDDDYEGLRTEVLRIINFWISKGVKIFRVDNPHTKPLHFWADLLEILHGENPDVIFLAEAFTSPAMMHALGKVGFHQSYTYFTWRTTKSELTEYGREISNQTSAFFRPNFWVNTPDINPYHLHSGNPAVFALRAVLASTLSPSWGVYAGFELFEHEAFKADGEEYLNSEKYEIKIRDWDGAAKNKATLAPLITSLNAIRADNPALNGLRNLVFHRTDSESIIAYSKREADNLILVVVNLDPDSAQATMIHWDMSALALEAVNFTVEDLLDGSSYNWAPESFVSLDPTGVNGKTAHICRVKI